MKDYKDKSKKKVCELADRISEQQNKYRQEIVHMKQVYEEKIKVLERDVDDKQRVIYDNKNQMCLLELQKSQIEKDKDRAEEEAQKLKNSVARISELEREYEQLL